MATPQWVWNAGNAIDTFAESIDGTGRKVNRVAPQTASQSTRQAAFLSGSPQLNQPVYQTPSASPFATDGKPKRIATSTTMQPPQAAPQRVAQSVTLPDPTQPQGVMANVAASVRAQRQPGPVAPQAVPSAMSNPAYGIGVGGQAQAARNAALAAGGMNVPDAQRRAVEIKAMRDAAAGRLATLRAQQYQLRQNGNPVAAAALREQIAQAEGEQALHNANLVDYYNVLKGSTADLSPEQQQANRDALIAQIPAARRQMQAQFDQDETFRRQRMMANERRMLEQARKNGGVVTPGQVSLNSVISSADQNAATDAKIAADNYRAGGIVPDFTPINRQGASYDTSNVMRDQATELADRAAASKIQDAERTSAVTRAVAEGDYAKAMAEEQKYRAEIERRKLMRQNEAEMTGEANFRRATALGNANDSAALDVQQAQPQTDKLANDIAPNLAKVVAESGAFGGDNAPSMSRLSEAMQNLETISNPNVKAEVAKKVLKQLEDKGIPTDPMDPSTMDRLNSGLLRFGAINFWRNIGSLVLSGQWANEKEQRSREAFNVAVAKLREYASATPRIATSVFLPDTQTPQRK